jgi:hypothetical protein
MSEHELAVIGLIVGVIGILIGILTSYYFYLRARERIEPRYFLQHEPLLGSSSGAMKEVSLRFKGNEVTNLNRCILVIWNKGKRTLLRSAVVDTDKVRVRLPEGCKGLGVGVAKTTRPVIGLTASIDKSETVVTVDFDFLDKDDGGLIEILYQGDPKLKPKLAGTIMGAPKGFESRMGTLSFSDEEDDEDTGMWKGWWPILATLCVFGAGSTVLLGLSHPLTVVLLTVLGEIALIALMYATLVIYVQRAVGLPDLWKETPQDVANPRIRID